MTSKTFSKNTRPAGSVYQNLPLILDPGSAHYDKFGGGFAHSEIIIGVQIQDQGPMASFDPAGLLFVEKVLDLMN